MITRTNWRTSILLTMILFVSIGVLSPRVHAQETATRSDKVAFDQGASTLAVAQSYTYSVRDNGGLAQPMPVTCVGDVTPFSCVMPLTLFTDGQHSITITTIDVDGLGSEQSDPFAFVMTTAPLPPPPPGSASAGFLSLDTTTKGNWKSLYGADGYLIANVGARQPAYGSVTVTAPNPSYVWHPSSVEPRALEKLSGADRIAAGWYGEVVTVDVHPIDTGPHRLAVYLLDWDGGGSRSERLDMLDAGTSAVLDSRSVVKFTEGQYVVWTISGHVTLRLTRTGGANAVLSAVFLDPMAPTPVLTPLKPTALRMVR